MTAEQIIHLFDTTTIAIAELSRRSGWTKSELRTLLLGGF